NVIDSNPKTWWSATKPGAGVWVSVGSNRGYRRLGIVSVTPGYRATVRYSNDGSPPAALSSWPKARTIRSARKKQAVSLPSAAQNAQYYLVVLESGPSAKH